MADPLSLLRDHYRANKPIQLRESEGVIVFGDLAFSKDARTNYVKYGTGKDGEAKEYYSLGCLYFFLQNIVQKHAAHGAYIRQAVAGGWPIVNLADRKDLVAYLSGEKDSSESIDKSAPLELPVHLKRQAPVEAHLDAAKRPRFEAKDAEQAQRDQERLQSLLEGQSSSGRAVQADNIRGLSDTLTADIVAKLKQKREAHKRTQVKTVEEEALEPTRVFDAELDVTRDILSKERQWRTRISCLEAQSRNFAKSVLPLLNSVKLNDDNKSSHTTKPPAPMVSQLSKPSAKPAQPTAYNRYAQETHKKEETGEFNIDTMGTYHGITLKSITEGAKPKAPAPAAVVQENIAPRSTKRTSRTPIIIIPGAATSVITMYNATDLLQDLRFVKSEDKKAQGVRRENQVLIHRTKENGTVVPYQVIDNPLKLTPDEWDRVVAVFVQGPAWQFKGWPWNGNPVEIFARIAAFHLKWEEQKLDANVAKWNVRVLALSQNKRHLDRASMLKFWEFLDKYMIKQKSHLRF